MAVLVMDLVARDVLIIALRWRAYWGLELNNDNKLCLKVGKQFYVVFCQLCLYLCILLYRCYVHLFCSNRCSSLLSDKTIVEQ